MKSESVEDIHHPSYLMGVKSTRVSMGVESRAFGRADNSKRGRGSKGKRGASFKNKKLWRAHRRVTDVLSQSEMLYIRQCYPDQVLWRN